MSTQEEKNEMLRLLKLGDFIEIIKRGKYYPTTYNLYNQSAMTGEYPYSIYGFVCSLPYATHPRKKEQPVGYKILYYDIMTVKGELSPAKAQNIKTSDSQVLAIKVRGLSEIRNNLVHRNLSKLFKPEVLTHKVEAFRLAAKKYLSYKKG